MYGRFGKRWQKRGSFQEFYLYVSDQFMCIEYNILRIIVYGLLKYVCHAKNIWINECIGNVMDNKAE